MLDVEGDVDAKDGVVWCRLSRMHWSLAVNKKKAKHSKLEEDR